MLAFEIAGAVVLACAIAAVIFLRRRSRALQSTVQVATPPPRVTSGEVRIVHSTPGTVEGLEIRYGPDGLVRSVRVGAMNSEHKELLMTMDEVQWRALPNAQKQEVLAAARSTWAQRMCADGPDIAYVVMKTEGGTIVGRADPHSVRVL